MQVIVQFFKEMSIGTAAPTTEELAAAKHHFIHNKSITEDYNVGAFEKKSIFLLLLMSDSKAVLYALGR